jgi:hypothetical protein
VGVLDDPASFYAPPQEDWALGDVVIMPTVALWAATERAASPYPQPAPLPDGTSSVCYPLWYPLDPLPQPAVEAWLSPAIIVADDCVLDKEFNAYVEQRMREGLAEAAAEEEARAMPSLDPLVPVAPILPYAALRLGNPQAIRTAQSIGYFPLVAWPDHVDEGYVDFTRIVPVSRQLLWGPAAALSEPARRILRWKLAQYSAYRNLSVDAEIMAAIGRTITAVRVVSDQKDRLVVDLEFDNGTGQLRLRQEPRRADIPPGHQRGRS